VALPLAATTPPVELVRGGSAEERISI
jgi:hypothetical protein